MGIFLLLAGLAVYAAVRQGVDRIDLKNGTITFSSVRPADIAAKQSEVGSQVAAAEQRASQAQEEPATSVPDISGQWSADTGLTYLVNQYGEQIVVQEISPYGVTAYGEGQVTGAEARFRFWAVNGVTGVGYFEVLDNARMRVRFDNSQGMSSQAILSRR